MSQKKDSTVYLLLALFLGGLGVHHFYLGRTTAGVLHLVFCWTLVPVFLSIAHAINSSKAVRERNMEIAQRLAVGLNVPVDELLKIAFL
ncbi:NINE protein [Deinococcus sp. HMF7620]|uniref:NINE protein n=2 Tax=Deinococcus arboris TaxID=2682977 RepID=A0A7C9HT75_9DEIO|nr:NINE protein [Deinococcus arboris]